MYMYLGMVYEWHRFHLYCQVRRCLRYCREAHCLAFFPPFIIFPMAAAAAAHSKLSHLSVNRPWSFFSRSLCDSQYRQFGNCGFCAVEASAKKRNCAPLAIDDFVPLFTGSFLLFGMLLTLWFQVFSRLDTRLLLLDWHQRMSSFSCSFICLIVLKAASVHAAHLCLWLWH